MAFGLVLGVLGYHFTNFGVEAQCPKNEDPRRWILWFEWCLVTYP